MLDKVEYYINRELSWLNFNLRVLEEAGDKHVPLLERMRFIAITASNLDEFFMIRVAGLNQQLDSGINKVDAAGLTVKEQLRAISEHVHSMVKIQYKYLKSLLANLEQQDIFFCDTDSFADKGKQWLEDYFFYTVYPVLTPMAVDSSHPFPFLANRSLNLVVHLQREKGEEYTAVIQVPGVLPRIVEVPGQGKKRKFVLLEDLIRKYCGHLFQGNYIKDVALFRITRNADLYIDEEDAEDLLAEVEKSLRQRKRGTAVRLEISKQCGRFIRNFLIEALNLNEPEIYEISGPIDSTCFMKFADLAGCEHLRYEPMLPQTVPELKDYDDIFSVIREKDVLLHHPYESFEPVIDFIRQAADDPRVLAIKQTLYRVSGNSPIVRALALAAENGKQVTVVVEVKARFDEENNILWARRLEEAGCHVIYGLVGLKTHAKMALIVRQEESGIKRYVHMGTGNYNDNTAKLYTDMSLFTANDQFGADASAFFNMLSGYSDPPVWNKIVVAPCGLRERIYELIDKEIEFVKDGKTGHIIAKLNSLIDKEVINKLYEASSKGVKVDLIVRGICGLKPGIANVSENITVRSIVGRFLEHHRIIYVGGGGDEKVYLSSADWMQRNLNERVELLFPVDEEQHALRIKEVLEIILKDTAKAYVMKSDGNYRKIDKRGKILNSQEEIYRRSRSAMQHDGNPAEQKLQPLYRKEG
jgi:polyphosphate kinase